MVADIVANLPLKEINRAYTYKVPVHLSFIDVGWRVFIPFGGRKVEGFIINIREDNDADLKTIKELKEIISAVDDEPWFSKKIIEICREISDFYLCSLAEIMRLFMPGKSGLKVSVFYAVNDEFERKNAEHLLKNNDFFSVYNLLEKEGELLIKDIEKNLNFDKKKTVDLTEKMTRLKLLKRVYNMKNKATNLYETYIEKISPITDEIIVEFNKRKKAQAKVLKILRDKDIVGLKDLKDEKISATVIKSVEEAGFIRTIKKRRYRDSYEGNETATITRELTDEQQNAYVAIKNSLDIGKYQGFLLHGVTGSGKTEVYIRAAESARTQNKKVVVLVPEIGLTGQLVKSFQERFNGDIAIIHSRLSVSERNDAIIRARCGDANIIIGARSALFAPIDGIGLIILDEEHDLSYKQDESPRYHAKVIAEIIAKQNNATLILGSATPSLETYYRAKTGEIALLTMKNRIENMPLPEVSCVDMRQELKRGNRHILSRSLAELIENTVAKKEQAIILLNRRGFSTFVMCRSCGEALTCKDCSLPLVYHKNGKLACHHCDIDEIMPKTCPKCGSKYIKYFGSGTEKLEEELKILIPKARVIRMDRDTTTKKFAHQEILEKFKRGEYDVLLGTQMVAKGHDVPKVTAVGIISADSSLHIPDFRAAERTFTLITQTSGRAGRHALSDNLRGKVIVQCYNTEHYAVDCAARNDYEGFYNKEISARKELFYPPFCRLIKLIFQGNDENKTKDAAKIFVEKFETNFKHDDKNVALGPSPAIIANLRGTFRFVVLIKTNSLKKIGEFLRKENIHIDRNIAIDIDPIMMF